MQTTSFISFGDKSDIHAASLPVALNIASFGVAIVIVAAVNDFSTHVCRRRNLRGAEKKVQSLF